MSLQSQFPMELGLEALKKGDAKGAFEYLSVALKEGNTDRNIFMGLAIAARALSRHQDSLSAIEPLLKIESTNFEALLLKADALKALDRNQEATSFYFAAIKAAPAADKISPILARELKRAQQECQGSSKNYEQYLRHSLEKTGILDGQAHSRNEQALDIMFGRKKIYYQQPIKFYFPELPQIQFYRREDFDWVESIEANFAAILLELKRVLDEQSGFEPYVAAESATPNLSNTDMMGNKDWTAFHLIKDGQRNEENIAKCPITMNALSKAPIPEVRAKSPTALFSRLLPGAHIPPHTGLMNTRLICHLPLIIPTGCILRVGNQERTWKEGELLIFDDSIEHDACNTNPTEQRVILLFDIWRPELHQEERALIQTIFEVVEDYTNIT